MFLLIFVVFLLIGGLVTFIAVQNFALVVHLDVFLWRTLDLPVGVWLTAAFLCGAVVLYLVSVLSALSDLRRMKALRKQVLALEVQVLAMSQTGPLPSAQISDDDGLASADTGPILALPDVVSGSQPESHIQQSSLSPLQKFRQ